MGIVAGAVCERRTDMGRRTNRDLSLPNDN